MSYEIDDLPPAPTRTDPANFSAKGDTLMTALPGFVTQANALAAAVEADAGTVLAQVAADNAASIAAAAASAASAATARDASIAAWASSMAPAEILPAMAASLHYGPVVRLAINNTSRDSDGGAWRKRCQRTSYYNEAINNVWRGQRANLAACWAVSGAAAGDYYQNTTDGKFYAIGGTIGSPTQTETFRGNTREFPADVAIVAETGRVVIYDIATVGCPMWMVFTGNNWGGGGTFFGTAYSGVVASSVSMKNGQLFIGVNGGSGGAASVNGLSFVNFVKDTFGKISSSSINGGQGIGVANRRTPVGYALDSLPKDFPVTLVNNVVNDVDMTVLPVAPIDAATGLPAPTVAVFTAGGVSVIHNTGTVVNSATTGNRVRGAIDSGNRLWASDLTNGVVTPFGPIGTLTASFPAIASYYGGAVGSIPATQGPYAFGTAVNGPVTAGGNMAFNTPYGVTLMQYNAGTPAKSMVAYITPTSNSGWQVGDTKFCGLADTVVETITGSGELVSNGDFPTATMGWTAGNSAALSIDTARLKVLNSIAAQGYAYQAIATVVGRTYYLSCDFDRGASASSAGIFAGSSIGSTGLGVITSTSASGSLVLNFVATATTTYVAVAGDGSNATFCYFDNISCKLAEPDRSVKNRGFVVNGSLNKSLIAAGGQIVGYSGWSVANYIEQPNNTNFDASTGDFLFFKGLVITTSLAAIQTLLHRSLSASAGGTLIRIIATTGVIEFYGTATTGYTLRLSSTIGLTVNVPTLVEVSRLSGTLYIKFNGIVVGSVADATNLTYASTVTRIGIQNDGVYPFVGQLALVDISATAPSAEQSAKIARDELAMCQPVAQVTLAGSSSAVLSMAYSESTGILDAYTGTHRSGFDNLVRVDSEASAVGTITSGAAGNGMRVIGGSTGAYLAQPAIKLRDDERGRQGLGALAFADYLTPVVQVLTSTQTFKPKRSGWHKVTVQAGGAGGATDSTEVSSGGGGGGAAIKTLWLDETVTYTATVGAGGAAVVATDMAVGNSGGNSSFAGDGISTISATGGFSHLSSEKRSVGGAGSGGDFNVAGGTAFARRLVVPFPSIADQGGSSYFGAGGRYSANGVSYGAGAGGVISSTTSFAGAPGVVIIEYLTY